MVIMKHPREPVCGQGRPWGGMAILGTQSADKASWRGMVILGTQSVDTADHGEVCDLWNIMGTKSVNKAHHGEVLQEHDQSEIY